MIKTDLKFGEVYTLASLAEQTEDKVNVNNIWGNGNGGVTLLTFKAGQALSQHTAPAEVMVCVVDGEIEFTMIDKPHTLHAGEFLLMGEGVPHSVAAKRDSKVMLIKIKG